MDKKSSQQQVAGKPPFIPINEWKWVPIVLYLDPDCTPTSRLIQNELIDSSSNDTHVQEDTEIVESSLFDLWTYFQHYNLMYFQNKLAHCECRWSTRMTLCAGQCHYQYRSGYCSIRLSKPLLQYRTKQDCINTLLHEMIHVRLYFTFAILYLFLQDDGQVRYVHFKI